MWAIVMAPRTVAHHISQATELMNGLFFYIGLGSGLAAACGLRPYLPVLLAGALGSAGALGVGFAHAATTASCSPAGGCAPSRPCSSSRTCCNCASAQSASRRSPPSRSLAQAIALGALLFAGTLADHGDASWPGLIGGGLCAALGQLAVRPLLAGARKRLPDRAAREALTIYIDGISLLFAALVCAAAPARLRAPGAARGAEHAHPPARRREVRRSAHPRALMDSPPKLVLCVIDAMAPAMLERAVARGSRRCSRR